MGQKRPCHCDRCTKGEAKAPGDCHRCWLFHNDAGYNRAWGGTEWQGLAARPKSPPSAAPPASAIGVLPCPHRGADLGQRVPCGPTSRCRAKVFGCTLLGHCTIGPNGAGLASCSTCDRRPA